MDGVVEQFSEHIEEGRHQKKTEKHNGSEECLAERPNKKKTHGLDRFCFFHLVRRIEV